MANRKTIDIRISQQTTEDPFITKIRRNTAGKLPELKRDSPGIYRVLKQGAFKEGKFDVEFSANASMDATYSCSRVSDDEIQITSRDMGNAGQLSDECFLHTKVKIVIWL